MNCGNVPIALLRHGETEGGARYNGATDVALTPTGWQQMWSAVDREFAWEAIHCSPLTRSAAFAHALGKQRTLPVYVDDRLCEMDFGSWEGRSAAGLLQTDAEALSRFWQDPWNHTPPHGEPLRDLRRRVLAVWCEIVARQRPVLIVSHGGPLRIILSQVGGYPRQLPAIEVPHATMFRVHIRGAPARPSAHGAS